MKKCTYCNKYYPDEAEVCAIDAEPLLLITPPPLPPRETRVVTLKNKRYNVADVTKIARYQLANIYLFLSSIPVGTLYSDPHILQIITRHTTGLLFLITLTLSVFSVIFIYRLARALKEPNSALYCLIAFIPLINFTALVLLMVKAAAVMKAFGLELHWLGSKPEEIAALGKSKEELEQLAQKKNSTAKETQHDGPPCISCNAPTQTGFNICPKCGWTQPRAAV